MDIKLPDGQILQNVPEGTSQQDLINTLKANNNANWEPMWKEFSKPEPSGVTGAIEETSHAIGSGLGHMIKGGLKGVADVAGSLSSDFSRQGLAKGAERATSDIEAEEAKTYQPTSAGAQAVSGGLAKVGGVIQKGAQWAGGKVQQGASALGAAPEVAGAAGATVETAAQALPFERIFRGAGALGKSLKTPGKDLARPKTGFEGAPHPGLDSPNESAAGARASMVKKAREAGYVLKPSEAGGSTAAKTAEGLTGSPRLSNEASIRNQRNTNTLAGKHIGLPEGSKITQGSLRKAKKPHNEVYKAVSQLGDVTLDDTYRSEIGAVGRSPGKSFKNVKDKGIEELKEQYAHDTEFNAADAVLEVRKLRAASSKNIRAPNSPAQNELGYAQRQIAEVIDRQLERHATALGHENLVQQLRSSRQALARIHSVESALLGNTGDVSALKLAKMQQRGVPLDGNLKLIADTADEFGEVMRDGPKVKNKVPVTVLEGAAGVGGGLLTATHSPGVGVPMLAGMVARPLARRYLLSERYQSKLGAGPKRKRPPTLEEIENPQ